MHVVAPDATERVWLFQKIMIVAVLVGLVSSALVYYGAGSTGAARIALPLALLATVAVPLLATLGVTHDRSQFALWILLAVTVVELAPLLPTLRYLGWAGALAVVQAALQLVAMALLFTDSPSRHWLHLQD